MCKKVLCYKKYGEPSEYAWGTREKNGLSIAHIVIEIETSEPSTLNASKVLFWGVVVFLNKQLHICTFC